MPVCRGAKERDQRIEQQDDGHSQPNDSDEARRRKSITVTPHNV